jgi:hypothetical protein
MRISNFLFRQIARKCVNFEKIARQCVNFVSTPNLGVGLLQEGGPELHPGGGAHVQQAPLPCWQQVVYHDF